MNVDHREFDVQDITEKTAHLHPDRIICKELVRSSVWSDIPGVTPMGITVSWALQ